MSRSVTYEQLVAYAAGRLPAGQIEAVEAFVRSNIDAAETVRRLTQVRELVRGDDSVAPPVSTIEAAKSLFRERTAPRTAPYWMAALDRVLANLIFDSRTKPALAGLRGGGDRYQLTFESEDIGIDLDIERPREGQTRVLLGQVSADDPQFQEQCIVLSEPGSFAPVTAATPDRTGMFKLEAGAGVFDLLIAVQGRLVVIPNLEIQ